MPLESATYISELVTTNPAGADDYATADDHIRLLKSVLQAQFPNLGAAAANPTAAELNTLAGYTGTTADLNLLAGAVAAGLTAAELLFVNGVTSGIQAQLDAKLDDANNVVDNANLTDMGQATIKGRASGAGTGDPTDLTAAQAAAIISGQAGLDADTVDGSHASAFAAASHAHAGADITSGTVAAARLGSGTPGSGNFLRGDSAWAQVAFSNLSGQAANGQITQGNVTQHQAAINHDALSGFVANEHRLITVDTAAPSGGANGDVWLRYV